jgi:hypothetical protein
MAAFPLLMVSGTVFVRILAVEIATMIPHAAALLAQPLLLMLTGTESAGDKMIRAYPVDADTHYMWGHRTRPLRGRCVPGQDVSLSVRGKFAFRKGNASPRYVLNKSPNDFVSDHEHVCALRI